MLDLWDFQKVEENNGTPVGGRYIINKHTAIRRNLLIALILRSGMIQTKMLLLLQLSWPTQGWSPQRSMIGINRFVQSLHKGHAFGFCLGFYLTFVWSVWKWLFPKPLSGDDCWVSSAAISRSWKPTWLCSPWSKDITSLIKLTTLNLKRCSKGKRLERQKGWK